MGYAFNHIDGECALCPPITHVKVFVLAVERKNMLVLQKLNVILGSLYYYFLYFLNVAFARFNSY